MTSSPLDLQNAAAVREAFFAGAAANRGAPCRRGSIDVVGPAGTLIATGDIHDNPLHFARLVEVAGMAPRSDEVTESRGDGAGDSEAAPSSPSSLGHLVLHELIHSDRLINGMDFSYRALARVAALKARFPGNVHTLLANHELSQITGAGIIKDGVRVVEAFNMGLEYVFGGEAPIVAEGVAEFVKSMPLALRCAHPRGGGDILCAHSVPAAPIMARFDPAVLERDLTEADYEPRKGAAHLMVWGRGYDAEQLEDLAERWGVSLFLLGHEKAENGARFVAPCAIVLNSDHERGAYLPIDLADPPRGEKAMELVRMLNSGD